MKTHERTSLLTASLVAVLLVLLLLLLGSPASPRNARSCLTPGAVGIFGLDNCCRNSAPMAQDADSGFNCRKLLPAAAKSSVMRLVQVAGLRKTATDPPAVDITFELVDSPSAGAQEGGYYVLYRQAFAPVQTNWLVAAILHKEQDAEGRYSIHDATGSFILDAARLPGSSAGLTLTYGDKLVDLSPAIAQLTGASGVETTGYAYQIVWFSPTAEGDSVYAAAQTDTFYLPAVSAGNPLDAAPGANQNTPAGQSNSLRQTTLTATLSPVLSTMTPTPHSSGMPSPMPTASRTPTGSSTMVPEPTATVLPPCPDDMTAYSTSTAMSRGLLPLYCQPKNPCVEKGWECGSLQNSLGQWVNCGKCKSSYKPVCNDNGVCVGSGECIVVGYECGYYRPAGLPAIFCGDCPAGKVCDLLSRECDERPEQCLPGECGLKPPGVDCGNCPRGSRCNIYPLTWYGFCATACLADDGTVVTCGIKKDDWGNQIRCGWCGNHEWCAPSEGGKAACTDLCTTSSGEKGMRCGERLKDDTGNTYKCECPDELVCNNRTQTCEPPGPA